jgi:hypothetical protein
VTSNTCDGPTGVVPAEGGVRCGMYRILVTTPKRVIVGVYPELTTRN